MTLSTMSWHLKDAEGRLEEVSNVSDVLQNVSFSFFEFTEISNACCNNARGRKGLLNVKYDGI